MTYSFKVYVTGESRRSLNAVHNLRALCDARLDHDVDIEVIDVLDRPEAADQAHIMATPTVIRVTPQPVRRVVGDLSDLAAAAAALDLPDIERLTP